MMKRLQPRRIALIAAGVVLLLLVAYGFMPTRPNVDTTSVIRGPMDVLIEEEGRTRVIDRFVVAAPISGVVRRIELEVGDAVEEGSAIVTIEPMRVEALNPQRRAEAEARVAAAKSALQSAEEVVRAAGADADLARSELERMQGLFDGDAATQRDVAYAAAQSRRAAAQKSSAEFSVEVARHNLDAAQTALRFAGAAGGGVPVVIKAPVSGRVLAVHQESEGVVSPGIPLLEVGDPERLEVAVDVLSQDATRLAAGMAVRFARWGGNGEDLRGVVRTVEPVGFTKVSALGVEEQRVWTVVDFVSDPATWSRLGDGYRVVAQFVAWEANDVLQLPSSALFRRGDGWATFVVEGGRAVERAVTVGQRSGLTVQIEAGVNEGDEVIVHPTSEVEDGTRIRVRS